MRAVVVDPKFHSANKWLVNGAGCLVDGLVNTLGCRVISSQGDYEDIAEQLDWVVATQPGWSAPWIRFRKELKHKIAMIVSDPHDKVGWLPEYVSDNGIDYLLCFYWEASLKFLKVIDPKKFVFFPWFVSDRFCAKRIEPPRVNDRLMIFGAMNHDAYRVRRWCCDFPFVQKYDNSHKNIVEATYAGYLRWLGGFGAIICAGSWEYPFVFPKFFEVAAAGSLLFGQDVADMALIGFNRSNCVMFNEDDFESQARLYLSNPTGYDHIRESGLELIRKRHLLSHRLDKIVSMMEAERYEERFS